MAQSKKSQTKKISTPTPDASVIEEIEKSFEELDAEATRLLAKRLGEIFKNSSIGFDACIDWFMEDGGAHALSQSETEAMSCTYILDVANKIRDYQLIGGVSNLHEAARLTMK